MKVKISLLILALFLNIAPARSQLQINTNKEIEYALKLTRRIYAQPLSTKIISDSFKVLLNQNKQVITETQLLAFLYENKNLWPVIETYLVETADASKELGARLKIIEGTYLEKLKPFLSPEQQSDPLLTIDQAESVLTENADAKPVLESYYQERQSAATEVQNKVKGTVDSYAKRFSTYLSDPSVQEKFQKYADPLVPLELTAKGGTRGYEVIGTYVNHPIYVDGETLPAKNLKEQVLRIIREAKHEIAINVFDFDLMEIADELIAAKNKGRKIKIGIDQKNIITRPEVKAVYDKLISNGIMAYGVNSVGLNHQKLIVIDWNYAGLGKVLLSSGNLTQSCIGPEGDLVALGKFIAQSKPNANHMVVIKSDLVSSVVHHEIAKVVDEGLRFRGKSFPVGGIYQFRSKEGTLKLAFSPNGAVKSINKNFIVKAISDMKEGDLKFVQFAFSSQTVESGILDWLKNIRQTESSVPLFMVVDKPFGMQGWSIPLSVSGMKLEKHDDKTKLYTENSESKWRSLLSSEEMDQLRTQIRIAPREFQAGKVTIDGVDYAYTVKIHHKLAIGGPKNSRIAIIGSFNFSSGAEKNQEFIARFDGEPTVSKMADGIADYLYKKSNETVYDEAIRRNKTGQFDPDVDPNVEQPKLKTKSVAIDCNELLQKQ